MNQVLRAERKFLISLDESVALAHRLEQVMKGDEYNGVGGYPIRSLYFDTLHDSDYYEKQDGVELRRKVRLRCYDPNGDFAMLEIKQKQGDNQLKRSLRVSREDAVTMTKGDYSPLLRYRDSFARECYALMQTRFYRPKTIVEYQRQAFTASGNDNRITFDSKVVSTESSFDLFAPALNMNPVLDPYDVILEVKYSGFLLNYVQQLIDPADRSELSVSKYVLARQNGYQTRLS